MTSDWSFTQGGPEEDPSNEFEVGQQFKDKEEMMLAVKQYSIRKAVDYKIVESDQLRYNAQYIQFGTGCNWSILISYRRKLDSKVIAQYIFTMVKADPTISIRVIQGGVENNFGYKASYRKGLACKTESDCQNIWRLGGIVQRASSLVIRDADVLVGSTDTVMFHRVFWIFSPCVEAFKHFKPLISIDGTHLYGKYGGTLLMVIAQDGNANILPIAFAVVEGETKEAWSFFLSYLREHVTPQPGLLVISDRHKSIDSALNAEGTLWKPPHAFQAFRTRHIAANFMTHFKNNDLKKVLINVAYSKSQREFAHYFDRLRGKNVAITNWLEEMQWSQWAQYVDEGRRFGHMTTNISKCINTVMKGSRNFPITALVKSSYFRLGEPFARKGFEVLAQLQVGAEFSQTLVKAIELNSKHVNTMNVYQFDRSRTNFTVEELAAVPGSRQQNYQVLLNEGTCDCQEFRPIGHEDDWPSYEGSRIQCNPRMMRVKRDRPVSSRIRNNMDDVEHNDEKRCGLYRQNGHTRRTCTALDGGGASSSRC
ncbi:uncharacterized protein LOC107635991 [Arachis ipaensis]|uniref:uncharacterized protein LOC107635991 n=1 Tax=Arachis ipaensis TaxID=130454 RepID=UPI0007AF2757|nr:uncharacterized protein LOC107635991 [Arachis ipaensis]XP_025647230.1 uncharacterized protein LOC112742205 [Arachis hypogaea]